MLDGLLLFSNAQALTATAVSTNIVDLGVGRDLGDEGEDHPLKVLITSDNAFASAGGTGTLTIAVQGAPDDGTGSPGTYYNMALTDALTITQLNFGAGGSAGGTELFPIDLPISPPGKDKPRFLRINYTVGTQNFTAGHITATLAIGHQSDVVKAAYPSGFTVPN